MRIAGFLVLTWIAVCTWPCVAIADENASRLSELLGSDADAGFPKATRPRAFSFPADHGPHPEYRNEWWYVTGNLDGDNARRFGFELTFFRFALTPFQPEPDSNWRTNQVYIAHFALTDADRERFFVAERFSRGGAGLAGANAAPFEVWIDDWEISAAGDASEGHWRLRANDAQFGIDVTLDPAKAPVLNGIEGLSQKSADPGNASYYYSITRLATEGTLRVEDSEIEVSGLSWLDREWSTSALAPDQVGWDWFALQLSDGSDLMFYNIRRNDGSQDRHSAGTWVSADGVASHIGNGDIEISVTDTWNSPEGGSYPAEWTIDLPRRGLSIEIRPVIEDQELFTTVRYWEGAVDVAGVVRGQPVSGRGYVELTGYAQ